MKVLLTTSLLLLSILSFAQLDILTGYQYSVTPHDQINPKDFQMEDHMHNMVATINYTVVGEKMDFDVYLQSNWLADIYNVTYGVSVNMLKIKDIPVFATGIEFSSQYDLVLFARAQYEYPLNESVSAFGRIDTRMIEGVTLGSAWSGQAGFRFCIWR